MEEVARAWTVRARIVADVCSVRLLLRTVRTFNRRGRALALARRRRRSFPPVVVLSDRVCV